MQIYYSSNCASSTLLPEATDQLATFTRGIELTGGLKEQGCQIDFLKQKQKEGFSFLLHNYFPPPKGAGFMLNLADNSVQTRDFIIASMKYVEALRINYYSIHPGYKGDYSFQQKGFIDGLLKYNFTGVKENIEWFFKQYPNHFLAVENSFPMHGNKKFSFGNTPEEMFNYLDLDPRVKLILDFGHLKVAANHCDFDYLNAVDQFFTKKASHIQEIHLSENDGQSDQHLLLTKGSEQYKLLLRYKDLIKKHKINLTIEAVGFSMEKLLKNHQLITNIFTETL